jgi:hypothetical protein
MKVHHQDRDLLDEGVSPDDGDSPESNEPLPNVEKCELCGQNFIAETQDDECDCRKHEHEYTGSFDEELGYGEYSCACGVVRYI